MTSAALQIPAVSVIIPVRNASGCIKACLEALRKQTLENLEFIFVDDASSDSSCAIISKAAQRDSRIILLQQRQQGGPGVARNRGIEAARGKYIGFVDADDAVNPGFYEALCRKAELNQAWVVKGSCIKTTACGQEGTSNKSINSQIQVPKLFFETRRRPKLMFGRLFCSTLPLKYRSQEKVSGLNERIRQGLANGRSLLELFNYEHWTGLYLRDFINRVGARNGECSQGEDNIFLMQVMCHLPVERFATEDSAVYYYRVNEDSVSACYDAEFLEQSYISLCKRLEYMATQPDSSAAQAFVAEQFEEKIYHRVVRVWGSQFMTKEQLRGYLSQCFKAMQEWMQAHPATRLGTYSRGIVDGGYSADTYLHTIGSLPSALHAPKMPENELERLRHEYLILLHEKDILRAYRRYKFLSYLRPGKKEHYRRKMSQLTPFIYLIKAAREFAVSKRFPFSSVH